uniref:Byssal protein-3 n=1 Tax=Mytilus coruscus TaxID=42192 RepID=A0A0G2YHT2_MYTCO|nr:byssal protein-3 [Mytilus coruscus]
MKMLQRRVSPVYVLAVIYMFGIMGRASGSETYGDCIKYAVGEIKPVLSNGDRFCLQEKEYMYCKEFTCPPTACEQPLVPENYECLYCEGTCSYGGTVYQVGSGFQCLDGVNRCNCGAKNRIASTKIAQNSRSMCL